MLRDTNKKVGLQYKGRGETGEKAERIPLKMLLLGSAPAAAERGRGKNRANVKLPFDPPS